MSYSIAARRADGHECRVARQKFPEMVTHDKGIPCTMFLDVEQAYLAYGGPKENYRPFLVLVGRPDKFQGNFPGDVGEVRLTHELDRIPINYTYEFTREDLATMAEKGLHESRFDVPDIIRNNSFELPCKLECYCVHGGENELPLLFVRPEDGRNGEENSLVCNNTTSGYTIGDYFEHVPEESMDEYQKDEGFQDIMDMQDISEMEDESERGLEEGVVRDDVQYIGEEDMVQQKTLTSPEMEHAVDIEDYRRKEAEESYQAMRDSAARAWREHQLATNHSVDDTPVLGAEFEDIDTRPESERATYESDKKNDSTAGASDGEGLMPDEPAEAVQLDREPDEFPDFEDEVPSADDERHARSVQRDARRMNKAENIDGEAGEEHELEELDPKYAAYVDDADKEKMLDKLAKGNDGRIPDSVPNEVTEDTEYEHDRKEERTIPDMDDVRQPSESGGTEYMNQ